MMSREGFINMLYEETKNTDFGLVPGIDGMCYDFSITLSRSMFCHILKMLWKLFSLDAKDVKNNYGEDKRHIVMKPLSMGVGCVGVVTWPPIKHALYFLCLCVWLSRLG